MKSRPLRIIVRAVVALFVVLFITLSVVWLSSLMDPRWYELPDPDDEEVAQIADRAEYGLVAAAQKVRPLDESWSVRLKEHEVNAWLSARLPQWLAHEHGRQWPPEFGRPQVHLRGDRIIIALDAREHSGGRVVQAAILPRMTDERLGFQLVSVGVGRIPVPGDPAQKLIEVAGNLAPPASAASDAIRTVLDIITGRTTIDPVMDLADHRRVRLQRMDLGDGYVDLTCVTLGRLDGAGD